MGSATCPLALWALRALRMGSRRQRVSGRVVDLLVSRWGFVNVLHMGYAVAARGTSGSRDRCLGIVDALDMRSTVVVVATRCFLAISV